MTSQKTSVLESGFTLTEVLVVIAIIAIILAFSIPNFRSGRFREETRSTARELAADARYAQTVALSQKVESTNPGKVNNIGVLVRNDIYRVFEDNGTTTGAYDSEDHELKRGVIPTGVVISSTEPVNIRNNAFFFTPVSEEGVTAGSLDCPHAVCTNGINITFTHQGLSGYQRVLHITPQGFIEVIE